MALALAIPSLIKEFAPIPGTLKLAVTPTLEILTVAMVLPNQQLEIHRALVWRLVLMPLLFKLALDLVTIMRLV